MDKQSFIVQLRKRLTELEVDKDNVDKYIKQFERYFNTMDEDEAVVQIETYDGVDGIARKIVGLIKKKQPPETAATAKNAAPVSDLARDYKREAGIVITAREEPNADTNIEPGTDTTARASEEKNAENTVKDEENISGDTSVFSVPTAKKAPDGGEETIPDAAEDYGFLLANKRGADAAPKQRSVYRIRNIRSAGADGPGIGIDKNQPEVSEPKITGGINKNAAKIKPGTAGDTPQNTRPPGKPASAKSGSVTPYGAYQPAKKAARVNVNVPPAINFSEIDKSYYEETDVPATALYWVILILTLPLTVPLLLTILVLFLAAFAILASLAVTLIAALIGVIIAGTALSLVGIIYGLTQVFTVMSVGLFEIGLGVVIGGSAMLAGILMYNTAVRFLPFVMRWLVVFFMFSGRKLGELLKYAKRECAKQ